MWHEAPELVLKHIFCYLEASDLHAVSLTCRLWHQVAKEDAVWKQLVQRLWKIKGLSLPSGRNSWRNEFRRLTYETPTSLSETLHEHTDEVLDVSFSHNGKLFCTTSKDATVKVWELGYPTKIKHNAKMLILLGWNLTQFSIFNKSDSFLCVCGVQFGGTVGNYFPSSSGRAAVFRTSDFKIMQTMMMEPPQLFADWYDDTTVLGGYVEENQTILHIKAFKVKEEGTGNIQEPVSGQIVYSFDTDHHHTMNLLVADLPCEHQSHDQSCYHIFTAHQKMKGTQHVKNGKIKETDSVMNKACSCEKQKMMIFVCGQHSGLSIHDVTNLHKKISNRNTRQSANSRLPNNSAKSAINNKVRQASGASGRSRQGQRNQSEANSTGGPGTSRELPGASVVDKPTHSPSFDKYYISGMKLSQDHRELYFNHRVCHYDAFDDEGYPKIDSEIVIDKYDLVNKTHTKDLLQGHKAFSKYPAWYICLDINQDYIVSGSEDGRAYLWDRHYLCFLGHLPHSINPDIVINGTTFCPTDSECVVTGADDGIIHVWRSPRRHAELEKQQGLVAMDM
ncbi:F-box/WD repeat-containing protein 5-like [Saccostrea echinata]|uniref:F-box/WD repeat-containing protein 5-like n=1 Tax=Saccostrea echinata TaxID=191078 RepID=UPI002A84053D|nr:F-box/WD repeat-containing protein 5-like [Saccostrea echinata]